MCTKKVKRPIELDFSIKMNVKWNDVEYVGENKFEIPQNFRLAQIEQKAIVDYN